MSNPLHRYQKADRFVLKVSYIVALCIIVFLLAWGGRTVYHFFLYVSTNDAQVKEYISPILSRTNGFVQEIKYTDHQQVLKGDTLLVLDNNEANVKLLNVQAEIAEAEAQLTVIKSEIQVASSNADINASKINAAKAHLWQKQQDYARYKTLLENEAATQQQFEAIKTQVDVAQSDYDAIRNAHSNSKDKISDAEARLAVAQAHLTQKLATLEQVKLDLKYTVIVAPSNGIMGVRTIQPGQYIQTGQTIGFMVDKNQGKWIVANFQETQIGKMHEGQKARIKIDAFPGEELEGSIISFSPATGSEFSLLPTDNATGNFIKVTQRFPVKIAFTGTDLLLQKLKAGMNAEVFIVKE